LKIYNLENVNQRELPTLESTSKDDIIIKENPTFTISLLKNFLKDQEIKLVDVSEEEEIIGDETDILKVSKIEDGKDNKIFVTYAYTFQIEEETIQEKVEIEIEIGKTEDNNLIFKFERIDGNLLYFKKIMKEIRSKCLGL